MSEMTLPGVWPHEEGPGWTFRLGWDDVSGSSMPERVVEAVMDVELRAVPSYVAGLRRLRHLAMSLSEDPFLSGFDTVIRERVFDEVCMGPARAFFVLAQDAIHVRPWEYPEGPQSDGAPLLHEVFAQLATVLFLEDHVGVARLPRAARLPEVGGIYAPVTRWADLEDTARAWREKVDPTPEQEALGRAWPTVRPLVEALARRGDW